jgi:hypothetical protein
MKKIVLALVALLSLVSCGGDDDNNPANEVVGKWVQTYYQNTTTNSFIGQEDGTYFLFNSDGSFTFFYSGWGSINETTTGKYKVVGSASLPASLQLEYGNGEKGTIFISLVGEDGNATFSVDGLLYTGVYKFKRR